MKKGIFVINTLAQANEIAKKMMDEFPDRVLGMDTETTVPSADCISANVTSRVSLIQLAGENRCWLFQTFRIFAETGLFSKELRRLLQKSNIIKVGVGLIEDVRRIESSYDVRCCGYIDLQPIAISKGIIDCSFDALATKFVDNYAREAKQIKNSTSRFGNWDGPLDYVQRKYAAYDAWLCLAMYNKLGMCDERDTDVVVVDYGQNDSAAFFDWLGQVLESSIVDRSINSIANQTANSFGPWRVTLPERERKRKAKEIVANLIKEKRLCQHQYTNNLVIPRNIEFYNRVVANTVPILDVDLQTCWGEFMKNPMVLLDKWYAKKSIVNQICNSLSIFAANKMPMANRISFANKMWNYAHKTGLITVTDDSKKCVFNFKTFQQKV